MTTSEKFTHDAINYIFLNNAEMQIVKLKMKEYPLLVLFPPLFPCSIFFISSFLLLSSLSSFYFSVSLFLIFLLFPYSTFSPFASPLFHNLAGESREAL